MSEVETIHIYHPVLEVESQVPPSTLATWEQAGWVEGRAPGAAEAEAAAAEAAVAVLRQAAAEATPTSGEVIVEPEAAPEEVAEPAVAPADPVIKVGRGQQAADESVPTGTNPTTPEEGN